MFRLTLATARSSKYLYRRRLLSIITDHFIVMPDIMDAKNGIVEKWFKREGEEFKPGDSLCEVLLLPADLTVAVDAKNHGVIAKLISSVGQTIPVNGPIAQFCTSKDEYFAFIDRQREADADDEKGNLTQKALLDTHEKPDSTKLIRLLKRLVKDGAIKDADVGKRLQSMARNNNPKLMAVYLASFDGDSYDDVSFDEHFFIENATELSEEINATEK